MVDNSSGFCWNVPHFNKTYLRFKQVFNNFQMLSSVLEINLVQFLNNCFTKFPKSRKVLVLYASSLAKSLHLPFSKKPCVNVGVVVTFNFLKTMKHGKDCYVIKSFWSYIFLDVCPCIILCDFDANSKTYLFGSWVYRWKLTVPELSGAIQYYILLMSFALKLLWLFYLIMAQKVVS